MDWASLFKMQHKLDTYILENHNLQGKNLLEEKLLALLVETGELANETRCFKFWSNKPANDKQVILEEYVDNIHFILSIGLNKGYSFNSGEGAVAPDSLTVLFNQVFADVLAFREDPSESRYHKLFADYLVLGQKLGFSEADVQQAYYEKNKINFTRQDEGY